MSQKKNENKEERIFLAAMKVFNEKGVHGARMQEIAEVAGVNKALLHYYFRSKEKLYLKVLEVIIVPFWETLDREIKALEDRNDFKAVVRLIAEIVVNSAVKLPYSSILLMEFASGGRHLEKMDSVVSNAAIRLESSVLSFFERLIEKKIIKPFNPLTIFVNILGMCWNIFLSEPFTTSVLESMGIARDEKYFEECIDSIVEMASAGMILKPREV